MLYFIQSNAYVIIHCTYLEQVANYNQYIIMMFSYIDMLPTSTGIIENSWLFMKTRSSSMSKIIERTQCSY